MANITYNRMIRKLTVAFGDLFNNITLVRYNLNESEQERFIVPLDYATKELYVMRLQGDPDLDKKVQMTLPRMSYEMNGLAYVATSKQITNIKHFAANGSTTLAQYMPVPYNFDFSLYLYVRNIEDGNQIIIPVEAADFSGDRLAVEMQLPNPISPSALGIGKDDRQLAIGLKSARYQ